MSIQQLHIKGFRSLHDVTWEPGKLNVVIGPNGSGKSNLLRAMNLLAHSARGALPEQILRQGGIAPLLWDGQTNEIRWAVKTDPARERSEAPGGALSYELHLRRFGTSSTYRVEHELLGNGSGREPGRKPVTKKYLERHPGHAVTFDFEEHQLVAHQDTVPDEQPLLSLVAGPFGNPVARAFKEEVEHWCIYHDVHVDQEALLRQPAVARMEDRLAGDGHNLIPVLHTLYSGHREFKKTVDSAMRAAFGPDFEELLFPPAADQRVQLRLRWRTLKREQAAADLSDGIIRFLVLLAIFANPQPGYVIAVDEPEAGLHPCMFPIVAELASEVAERVQIILTTHSPEFLDAFRDETPTTTVAQFVDGRTHLSILDGDELERWLREYTLGALWRSGELEGLA